MKQSTAYQFMDAAGVVNNLQSSAMAELPKNERQARPLTSLPPEQQREAWQEAVETAPAGKVTAKHVAEVAAKYKQSPATTTPVFGLHLMGPS